MTETAIRYKNCMTSLPDLKHLTHNAHFQSMVFRGQSCLAPTLHVKAFFDVWRTGIQLGQVSSQFIFFWSRYSESCEDLQITGTTASLLLRFQIDQIALELSARKKYSTDRKCALYTRKHCLCSWGQQTQFPDLRYLITHFNYDYD